MRTIAKNNDVHRILCISPKATEMAQQIEINIYRESFANILEKNGTVNVNLIQYVLVCPIGMYLICCC